MLQGSEVAALLEQTGWIRALARGLAADTQHAEDLVQDAWVAALERPPDTDRPVRGWLATVLRNRQRDLRRERARHRQREQAAARAEAMPSAHDVVEKAAIQRRLVEAVLELDEPFRTTVLLRFFEELPQREIARRMRTTTATVNGRLTRALEKLRQRLSREGGRSAWLQVLAPLLQDPPIECPTAPVAALGVSAMKAVVATVLAALIVAGIALWRFAEEEPSGESAIAEVSSPTQLRPPESASISSAVPAVAIAPEAREPVSAPPVAPPLGEPVKAGSARIVRGRVLDASGVALPGVALALGSAEDDGATSPEARCTSGAGGWFEMALESAAESIVSADPRFETVLAGAARVGEETQPTVVVAPRIQLSGTVLDELGAPLAGVWVALRLPASFGADWELVLDYSLPRRWVTRTGADGRFDLGTAPAIAGATLHAAIGGFTPHAEPAPERSDAWLEIVLRQPSAVEGVVRGVVLDPFGSAVEGAYVSAGAQSSLTDPQGEFALDVSSHGTKPRILAAKCGYQPASLEPEVGASGAPHWPNEVVLQLGAPAGVVRGRVLDHAGRGVPNARVWIDDPTYFGDLDGTRLATETIVRGSEEFWSYATTDADGSFELDGLLERAYRLQAIDPVTLASAEARAVRAGGGPIEIRLPTDELFERIAGRVVTLRGEPIPGVKVRVHRITYELEHADGTDNESQDGAWTTTDEHGAFELEGVPKQGIFVIASADSILTAGAWLEQERDVLDLSIQASLRVHLQVQLDEPFDRADSVSLADESGKVSYARIIRGGGAHMAARFELTGGRSEVLAVEESVATVVLHLGEQELARIPVRLVPGDLNVVRY